MRYIKKLQSLGVKRAIATLYHRVQLQHHILQPILPLAYKTNAIKHVPAKLSFFNSVDQQTMIAVLMQYADAYTHNYFDILGSGQQQLHHIPWHCDIRLYAKNSMADCVFDADSYFKDITIVIGNDQTLSKDIKVPWELARFHYAPILGLAYQVTKNKAYANAAQQQISSWLDANRFCHGIHWYNGMEVGIRAVNWIVALQWLQLPFKEDENFYERLLCSLYDHMRYLEYNWEWYDGRTNNHYLANIVGYAYLCWFFKAMPCITRKWRWCYDQLLQEFDWQIFDEGTSYEGSTRYHVLVTELFVHGFLIAQEMGKSLPAAVRKKLIYMLQFIKYCKPADDQPVIAIGDDDGGSLLHKHIFDVSYFYPHLSIDTITITEQKKYYKNFGISLFKRSPWHVTLRHHAYSLRQPTGHFHRDVGSITIAYRTIPIIVDPGTYVYTASSYWRNYFRSAAVHNTVYQTTNDNGALFCLPLESSKNNDTSMQAIIKMPEGIIERSIIVENAMIRIIDHCQFDQPQTLLWNLTFSSQVALYQDQEAWYIKINGHTLRYNSSLTWFQSDALISPHYGHLRKTYRLHASQKVAHIFVEHSFVLIL